MISIQKSQKALFVTIFYLGYNLFYAREPSQCPWIWSQKKIVLQTQNDENPEKCVILSPDDSHMFNNSSVQCMFHFTNIH